MFICELCGNTVSHVNHADVCKSCASMTFKAVKQEVKKDVEDKDNQEFMLAYFNISSAQFEAVTHENLSDIVDSEFASWYKNDAKRVLWHDYRANAFTKKGTMKKAVEKKILATIAVKEVATKEVEVVKAEPMQVARNEREQYALDKAAEHRATAKLLGAQALTGSPKQKAWAEKLREDFISKIEGDDVLEAILINRKAQNCKFWIELRDCECEDISDILLGDTNFNSFIKKHKSVRYAKKALEDFGRDNKAVQFRLQILKDEYGVEL